MTIQVEILQFLHYNPSSSRVEISAGLTEAPNERTLKRIIAELVQNGDVMVLLKTLSFLFAFVVIICSMAGMTTYKNLLFCVLCILSLFCGLTLR